MGAVKDMYMDEAETILSVTANRLVGGEIDEDGALKILEDEKDLFNLIGLNDKYDSLAVIYEMTDQLHKKQNGD